MSVWPAVLKIRDTGLHDDLGGGGQRIYTTAGRGYEKRTYYLWTSVNESKGSDSERAVEIEKHRDELFVEREQMKTMLNDLQNTLDVEIRNLKKAKKRLIQTCRKAVAREKALIDQVDFCQEANGRQYKMLRKYRIALDKLSKLGNEPQYGNSTGNMIARKAMEIGDE